MRKSLVKNNIINDQDWRLQFKDGSAFDMGADGGARLKNAGVNIDGRTERQYSDVDFSNKYGNVAAGWMNPLTVALMGDNNKHQQAFGNFANAIMQGATSADQVRERGVELATRLGFNADVLGARMAQLKEQGKITDDEFRQYQYGIGTLFNQDNKKGKDREADVERINKELAQKKAEAENAKKK